MQAEVAASQVPLDAKLTDVMPKKKAKNANGFLKIFTVQLLQNPTSFA
jgi:hypothetical protein